MKKTSLLAMIRIQLGKKKQPTIWYLLSHNGLKFQFAQGWEELIFLLASKEHERFNTVYSVFGASQSYVLVLLPVLFPAKAMA